MPAGMNLDVAKNRCPITQVRVKATAAIHRAMDVSPTNQQPPEANMMALCTYFPTEV